MGRTDGEQSSSPQNKLKDIIHTLFKKNDQVAGDLLTGQTRPASVPAKSASQDAFTTVDGAAGPNAAGASGQCTQLGQAAEQQQQEQAQQGSWQRDSASTLDADGAAPTTAGDHAVSIQQEPCATTQASAGANSTREQVELPAAFTTAEAKPETPAQSSLDRAGMQEVSGQRSRSSGAPQDTSSATGTAAEHITCAVQNESCSPTQQQVLSQLSDSGAQQQQAQPQQAPSAILRPGRLSAAMHSEPCPNGSAGGARVSTSQQRKMLCASVDDLYQELFGDVPLPSACSSAAQSPYGGHLASIRGVSSMSPMTTSSAFCHQHAAAAAIAGSGGMPGMGAFGMPAASPMPVRRDSNSMCSSYEGYSESAFGGCADAGTYGDCAGNGMGQGLPAAMMDDMMLPPGAYPPRVRILPNNQTPNPSRFSGSDGCSSSLFPDESPSCCSSSAGGNAWPMLSTEDGPSVAVSSRGSGQGWGSRGSLRYGSPTVAATQQGSGQQSLRTSREGASPLPGTEQQRVCSTSGKQPPGCQAGGTASAPGSADVGKPVPKSSLRTRWSNWISGSAPKGCSASSQNLQLQVQQQPSVLQQQDDGANVASQPWLAHSRQASPRRNALAAQSAPGNAAAQAMYNSVEGRAAMGSGSVPTGIPLHQLVHCHSNPELVQAAAFGSVGHGRGQFQRSSALGGHVPPCARSLFGSVPQMERPLVMAGSVGNSSSNNSSGWLSGPGGVTFGAPARNESFGMLATLGGGDDAISIASADEESIRQVNADNVLSSTWGPGSQSASGGGPSGIPLSASHPKLLAFKYCCATSPLNHPGRASPFNSARNSPFNSPRGTKDMLDLLPLRNAAASVHKAAASCPGSPLGMGHNNIFSSSVNSTPAVSSAAVAAAAASGQGRTPAATGASASTDGPAQQAQHVLNKQHSSSSSNQLVFESAASAGSEQQQQQELEQATSLGDAGASCSSSGSSNSSSSSKPPLQGRPVRGLLRTPPPPLPLPVRGPSLPSSTATAAAGGATAGQAAAVACHSQHRCGTAAPGPSHGSNPFSNRGDNKCNTGPTAHKAAPALAAVPGFSNSSRRVSAPAGLSAFMMRFSSNSGANSQGSGSPSNTVNTVRRGCQQGSPSAQAMAGAEGFAMVEAEIVSTSAQTGASSGNAQPQAGAFSRSSAHSLPLPLPSCSIDVGSPKQQVGPVAMAADSRCSPRRQSSSRLGASGGFTTPSRLSHNSTMAEALVTGSGGGGLGGFALQRTSSCCSSSSGWPGAGSANYSGGRSSNGFGVGALPGHDGGLLSTTSVPLSNMYDRGARGVDCSDSSEGSWMGRPSASSTVIEALQEHEHEQEQEPLEQQADVAQHQQQGVKQATLTACTAGAPAATAAVGGGRYGSCNGASDASAADCQNCAYPSWDSSSWSPLPPTQQQQPDMQAQSLKAAEQQQQQQQQQQLECGQRRQPGQAQGVSGDACAAVSSCTAGARDSEAGGAGSNDTDADAAAAIPPSLPEVDFLEKIGRGSFGDVFKGVWCGSVVAVKVIQVKQPSALTFPTRASTQQQQCVSADEQSQLLGDSAAAAATADVDSQAAQVALELAQHEYESWLNANLRHPNIVQLFTSFTIGLEERSPSMPAALLLSSTGGGPDGAMAGPLLSESGGSGALSWKTHLVMEYCELGTMQDLLQRGVFSQGTLPGASHLCWVLATAKEFCTAVSYLHSMDVVHGDLKSSNVLLKAAAVTGWDTRGFVAKVSDFGLSRVMDAISAANRDGPLTPCAAAAAECASATPAASTAGAQAAAAAGEECAGGTAAGAGGSLGCQPCQPRFGALSHAAPELIQGQELSKASDVYSIGVLLWELLTGQAPFYGMHPGQLLSLKLSQHTSQLLPFPPTTPAGLQQLCLDCWSDSPTARPSMPAVVQRINDLAVGLLGQEQAVALFPDVAASLAAQRRQAMLLAAQAAKPVRC